MMCVNTYSLVKRVCVGHASYILSSVLSTGNPDRLSFFLSQGNLFLKKLEEMDEDTEKCAIEAMPVVNTPLK